MSAKDKLKEAEFFLGRFIGSNEEAESRYFFNAFVSAWRSVTFVLQKDYRTKFGAKFDEWYEEKTSALRCTEAAGNFLKIRTITQKEGNKYPLIVMELITVAGDKFTFTWDMSREEEGLISHKMEYVDGPLIRVSEEEDVREALIESFAKHLISIPLILKQAIENKQFFSLGENFEAITKDEIIRLSKLNLSAVSEVVTEAETLFGVPKYGP